MREGYTSHRRYTLVSPAIFACILLACMACWVISYVTSVGYPVYGEVTAPPLWNTLCRILPGKAVTYTIGFLLMVGGAALLHRANYALMLIREKTLLPFLFYILFSSTNPDFFPLKATSLGVFCLILAIYQLFTSYHEPEARTNAYNSGLLIATGSLLWVHLLWFLPLSWIGMYNFRTLNIRTFLASVCGVGTLYWFLLGWCIWQNNFTAFTLPFTMLFKAKFLTAGTLDITQWAGITGIAILTLLAAVNILTHEYEDTLRTRQYLSFLIAMAVWIFVLYFQYEQESEEFMETASIPASILVAHFFTVVRSRIVSWLFYLSILFFISLYIIRIWNFL
ncbi:MAG: hypothetical protein LUD02_04360 [Tannerellaceae bacterium]|nr:hypothetical protein [Tannerellaceae bacterium]MCD8263479.1 hypothetical protein [Tannerellaceae bacterium]